MQLSESYLIIGYHFIGKRIGIFANIAADEHIAFVFFKLFYGRFHTQIVKSHTVNDAIVGNQSKQPFFRISCLRFRGYGSDF